MDAASFRRDFLSDKVAGSARAYAAIWLLVVVFILYGSLFPFIYRERYYPGGPILYLLSTWRDWDHRGDLLSNILLYMPFGFFGTSMLPARIPARTRALLLIAAGTALACCVEILQFHDMDRVTSMGDVYANAIGSAVGAGIAVVFGASIRWPFVRELAAHPAATLLLVMFLAYRLYPYVPMIDLHKYWHAIWPIVRTPSLPPGQFLRYLITWLFIAVVVHSLYGFTRFLLLFPLLCGAEFLGKIMIVNNVLTLPDVLGAVLAYLLWALLLRTLPGRFAIVAGLFGTMVVVERLEPFSFTMLPHAFSLVPFGSFMRGSMNVAMQAFCQKFYEYGGIIWLLNRAGVPMPLGTVATALVLLGTSLLQCWLPERSAEITDALMALILGGAFMVLRSAARSRRGGSDAPAGPQTAAAREHARFAEAILAQHGIAPAAPRRRGRKYAPYVPPRLRG